MERIQKANEEQREPILKEQIQYVPVSDSFEQLMKGFGVLGDDGVQKIKEAEDFFKYDDYKEQVTQYLYERIDFKTLKIRQPNQLVKRRNELN